MSICHKILQFLKDLKPTTDSFILWSMVLLYFNFEIEDKTPHKDGPTWPPGHWFHFPIFQIKIFGVSKRWVLSVSLQLKLRHRASTLQIISLNISLFTSQCNADFGNRTLELKIPFCTFKGLQFTRNFHPWDICVYKDKSSVLNEPHLQLPFLLLLQIIAIFLWLWKQHNTQYLFSQLFCALILTLRSIFHDNAVALWI